MKHCLQTMPFVRTLGAATLALFGMGCTVDEVPSGLRRTPAGSGPSVRFDLYHQPLPEIPLPNDAATWPDPTSRTGLRINASLVAPTAIEAVAREKFDTLEGWGTYAPLTVAFDKTKADDPAPAIDLPNLVSRHQRDDYDFADDAVYLVNLTTGLPTPLDLGEGSFQYVIREKSRYFRNDTRALEQNLLWETADETVDTTTGAADARRSAYAKTFDPAWDTDFDGVLDQPNLIDPKGCPNQAEILAKRADPNLSAAEKLSAEVARDACITDKLLSWYERETDTLIMRPLLPLDEKTEYAVMVTDRVVDARQQPVRSPFEFVYHPAQERPIARLENFINDPKRKNYWGDIAGTGLSHVAFAWSFTTQPVVEDLRVIRDGLYGKGPLARLAREFPPDASMLRAVGRISAEDLAAGVAEPADWEKTPECQGISSKLYTVQTDKLKNVIRELARSAFGLSGPSGDELMDGFDNLSHMVVGTVRSPFFISGGPKGTDPNASFNMDFASGEGELGADEVQFLLAVPKESAQHKQPFPVAYYGHGYTSSMVEALGFAGSLAAQGIASVGMNATFHQLEIDPAQLTLAKLLFSGGCVGPHGSALLSGRGRDLDGDGLVNSGGDYWTSYLFHTRDVVRQSAVDLLQLFRTFKAFGTRPAKEDYDSTDGTSLAGDFDANGVADVGGPNVDYFAWGQSLGGILAPFVAALDPAVTATVPGSGAAGLLDVGARTFQGGAFEGIYLRNFGPLIVGVPATEVNAETTRCDARDGVVSLRFVAVAVNNAREVEFGCLDLNLATGGAGLAKGGTVIVDNKRNGLTRCARMDATGHFRIGIPTSAGDALEVEVWNAPDAIDSYDPERGCNPKLDEAQRIALIDQFGSGIVPNGAPDPSGRSQVPVCNHPDGCSEFLGRYYAAGSPLVAIAEGFGHIRQTPSLRRFMSLASNVIDPGDPVNYVPYFSVRTLSDPEGRPQPPTGMLNFVTIGDMNVPLNSGIAIGRVAGAIPFLRPEALNLYPEYADYVTPQALYDALGGKTPNRELIETHVVEGINRLRRQPPAGNLCGRNELPLTNEITECHGVCVDRSNCQSGQECIEGRCRMPPVSETECQQSLYDIDVIDEGNALYGEQEAAEPLRVARVAMPATAESLEQIWAPRLRGEPRSDDQSGWQADRRVVAQLMAYTRPLGEHGFSPADPCENWATGRYMINLIGRFFATSGADVYYLSHPATHQCLARTPNDGGCPFVLDLGP